MVQYSSDGKPTFLSEDERQKQLAENNQEQILAMLRENPSVNMNIPAGSEQNVLNTTPHALDGGASVRSQKSAISLTPPVVSPPVAEQNRMGLI